MERLGKFESEIKRTKEWIAKNEIHMKRTPNLIFHQLLAKYESHMKSTKELEKLLAEAKSL